GVIPAIPLILIRPFMPESPAWQEKKAAGTLRRPSFREIFAPALLRTTVVTTIMMACAYGAAFGAIQQLPQVVPGLPEVTGQVRSTLLEGLPELSQLPPAQKAQVAGALLRTSRLPQSERAAAVRAIPQINALPAEQQASLAQKLRPAIGRARSRQEHAVASVASYQEIGGLVGRLLLAVLAVWIVSRRGLLRIFQVPGLIILPFLFFWLAQTLAAQSGPGAGDTRLIQTLQMGIFLAGMLTVAQFSFWGNYLPRVYPVHLRGTGESFAANIGGRMIGTAAALLTTNLAGVMPQGASPNPTVQNATQFAYAAAAVGLTVYVIGFLASFWLPEPDREAPAE
ncbi:MAG TPA: hypothetical protein VK689_22205, partial [Armatimonadota bacterium]|nr:hypothetical protein [Armatimonadota bacterium]